MNSPEKSAIFGCSGFLVLWPAVLGIAAVLFGATAGRAHSVEPSRARIGAKTQAMVQVLRPSQVTNVSALVGDGTIIAIGGHNGRATDKMLANIALQKAAGLVPALDCNAFDLPAAQLQTAKEKVRILVCAQASSLDQKSKKKDALATFAAAGLAPTAITVANGLVDAQFPFHEYDMIYFAGGDQNRLKRMFSAEAIANLHRYLNNGGIVCGTSAGAAILSKRMIAGGVSPQDGTFSPQAVQMREGFGFFECMPIDMHLFQFHRFARPMAALALDPRFADGKTHAGAEDEVVLALGQDSAAFIQAVKLEPSATGPAATGAHGPSSAQTAGDNTVTPVNPAGAVKVTIFGTTQSWIYQRGHTFQSNVSALTLPQGLAEAWDVNLSVVAPGSWFIIRW